jgi:hypothetical protein
MSCPSHPPWLEHSNWRRVQVMKLFIMQFSPTFCHFISLRSKYSPQHPVLKHPQPMFLPLCQKTSFTNKCFFIYQFTWFDLDRPLSGDPCGNPQMVMGYYTS